MIQELVSHSIHEVDNINELFLAIDHITYYADCDEYLNCVDLKKLLNWLMNYVSRSSVLILTKSEMYLPMQ